MEEERLTRESKTRDLEEKAGPPQIQNPQQQQHPQQQQQPATTIKGYNQIDAMCRNF